MSEFKRQHIIATVEGRRLCPKCKSPLLEVIGDNLLDYDRTEMCTRWKLEKIKCGYFREVK